MVARGGIEPPTADFQSAARWAGTSESHGACNYLSTICIQWVRREVQRSIAV